MYGYFTIKYIGIIFPIKLIINASKYVRWNVNTAIGIAPLNSIIGIILIRNVAIYPDYHYFILLSNSSLFIVPSLKISISLFFTLIIVDGTPFFIFPSSTIKSTLSLNLSIISLILFMQGSSDILQLVVASGTPNKFYKF